MSKTQRPFTGESVEPLFAELRRTRLITSWQVCRTCFVAYHRVNGVCPRCAPRLLGNRYEDKAFQAEGVVRIPRSSSS